MTRYDWRTEVGGTAISNVESINISWGRQSRSDPFRASTCTITGHNPSALPSISVGTTINVKPIVPTEGFNWFGRVRDYQITYGIVPNEDTWEISAECYLGAAGRTVWTGSTTAGSRTANAAATLAGTAGINVELFTGDTPANGTQFCSSITGSSTNVLDSINQLANTEQGWLTGNNDIVNLGPRRSYNNAQIVAEFSDTTPQTGAAAIAAKFDRIDIGGIADNTASQVVVQPDGLANQTTGSPPRSLTFNTFHSTTAQALETSQFIYGTLDFSTNKPLTLTAIAEAQTTDAALIASDYFLIFRGINIQFRGVKHSCVVEGATITASPSSTRFTYYLTKVPVDKFRFTLDSTSYGVLGQNRLG